ncbi:3-ketoacyl CoA thiolase 1, peroxisomal-like [Diospyros lotus]|uniref:3-ketoacyl CoA thiolase 1, peroxisomal-like n=1 Tax=Diospyros lotus TaxID=55363 RepID=UPI00225461D3|nr:3-ketoacyl CoA thiolase 1, peroxisomal-like [Diospyros lotus]
MAELGANLVVKLVVEPCGKPRGGSLWRSLVAELGANLVAKLVAEPCGKPCGGALWRILWRSLWRSLVASLWRKLVAKPRGRACGGSLWRNLLVAEPCGGALWRKLMAELVARLVAKPCGEHPSETVPIRTVNRQCLSGHQAVADDVAVSINAGLYDIGKGIAAGVEFMTVDQISRPHKVNPRAQSFRQARDCRLPMGITSENVAEYHGVTRQEQQQDQAAVESHKRAAAATASGKFKDEIVPVSTKIVDPKTGKEKPVTISVDEGIRPNTNIADLEKLMPAFKKDGLLSWNASQVSDGAGAVLLMKRSVAMQKGLPILGVLRCFAVAGVDPAVMGIGPAVAIPAAVKSAGLELNDIDLFEINEAFASQFVYCCKKLALDTEKVNVNGGAIALGHPLGATGARCVATLLNEMKRRGKGCRYGVISMCIGSGMGAAAVFQRGDSVDDFCNARVVRDNNLLSKDAH